MSKRILVVEDQKDDRQIIRDVRAGTDYEITEAEDGEQALTAVAKERPDLILMGIQLPIIDGYEVTRKIKADPAMRSIPIIAVTSYALSGEVNYWRKLGNTCPKRGTDSVLQYTEAWLELAEQITQLVGHEDEEAHRMIEGPLTRATVHQHQ
jgi:two-component system, cell cycle response regulator DivK